MKENYDYCLAELLKDEGGYSNDPMDVPTKYGITIIDYRKYVKHDATIEDVKHMTVDEAKAIYRPRYWDAVHGDDLPSGVDYCVFDYGVNSGVSRGLRIYGKFRELQDPVKIINAMCDERLAFLQSLKKWPVFKNGWTRRIKDVRAKSLKLAGHVSKVPATTTAGAVVLAGAGSVVAASQSNPNWMPYIIAGTVAAGLITWLLVHWYQSRKVANV